MFRPTDMDPRTKGVIRRPRCIKENPQPRNTTFSNNDRRKYIIVIYFFLFLIFYFIQLLTSDEFQSVWRVFGNQGNVWIQARLSISEEITKAGYQVYSTIIKYETASQILGVSRAFLQLVERMVQIEPFDFFSLYFFFFILFFAFYFT